MAMKKMTVKKLCAIVLTMATLTSLSGPSFVQAADNVRTVNETGAGGSPQKSQETMDEPMAANGIIAEDGETEDIVSSQADVSFGVVSDTHVTAAKATEQARLKKAFQFYSNSGVDSMVVDGDLTDTGAQSEYDTWKEIKDENLTIPLIATMGNHEGNSADRFIATTGNKPNDHKVLNGYHFITVSPGSGTLDEETGKASSHGGGNYSYVTSWLKEQMDAAYADDPNKPIFVFFHHPIKNTFYVSNEWYGSGLDDFFKDYPTAVTFSGHIHSPNNMPTSIWQDGGYTAVNTVTLSYMEMETGMIYGSIPPNASQIAQGLVVEADGSRVTIKNYDFLADQWIPQTWTFDVKDTLPYTDDRQENAKAPYFDEDAKLTVSNVTDDSADLTFTQAKVAENNVGDIVHSYRYDFINTKTGNVDKTFKTWSNYYLLPMPETMEQTAPDLEPGTSYEVQIHAINAYQQVSENYLSANFTTTGQSDSEPGFDDMILGVPKADMLDVDFSGGQALDHSEKAHALEGSDGSNIGMSEELGKETAVFTGKASEAFRAPWSEQDYDKINDGFTLESVFKVDEFSGSYVDLFGNMESAGIGFEISKSSESGKANLEGWVHLNGSYKIPAASAGLEYGKWYHTALTYDGKKVTLYLNGKKVSSMNATGEVKTPPNASRYYVIGGDSGSNGGVQSPMVGEISTARIYGEPLSAKQVNMLANRDLTTLDKQQPLIQVAAEPAANGTEGREYVIPAAKAADNSTIVTLKAVVTDQTLNEVLVIGGEKNETEETTFVPEAGTYKLTYTAVDKAGNVRDMTYTISVDGKEAEQVSTAVLEYALELADNADTQGVLPSVVAKFEAARDKAQALLEKAQSGDPSITQEDIDETWKELITWMQYFSFKQGEKTDLAKVIALAQGLNLDNYLEQGQEEFLTALEAAKKVQSDENAMQEEVDAAWTELLNTMADLRLKPDKSALEQLIGKAKGMSMEGCEEEIADRFGVVLAKAVAVYDNEQATKEEVDGAVKNLEASIKEVEESGELTVKAEKEGTTILSAYVSGNTESNGEANNQKTSAVKSVKTGDTTAATAALAVMLTAALAAGWSFARKKRV